MSCCRSGGIGRRAAFRSQWEFSRGGSNPPPGTMRFFLESRSPEDALEAFFVSVFRPSASYGCRDDGALNGQAGVCASRRGSR